MPQHYSAAKVRKEVRCDFCAYVLLYQQAHDDASAPRAYEIVSTTLRSPFRSFHAFEIFFSRNREYVRGRSLEISRETAKTDESPPIYMEEVMSRPDVHDVNLAEHEYADRREEDREFILRSIESIKADEGLLNRILKRYVVSTMMP